MSEDPRIESLKRAIAAIGSQSATARVLGISQASVWGWLKRGTPLPAKHVLTVEAQTGISRHDLRPDLYPREVPSTLAPRGTQHVDRPDAATRHHFGAGLEQAR